MDHTDRLTFKAVATMVKKDLLNRTQASQAEKLRLESKLLIEDPLSIYFDLHLAILNCVSWMGVI